ncbi:DUF1659 domain-containing protein [Tumebacillus lipolyticus]|uniref:DUF1659 domain-containing protein n=1 Tax=Tumebacillus lipolyticus TaxID=1280370 RepID=A0ABW5A1S9_9BACL
MIDINKGFSSMVLRLQTGVDQEGNAVYKDKSYPRILPTVNATDLYEVGEALASLSSWRLSSIQRVDREDLIRM